jgi:hypothetical protein
MMRSSEKQPAVIRQKIAVKIIFMRAVNVGMIAVFFNEEDVGRRSCFPSSYEEGKVKIIIFLPHN